MKALVLKSSGVDSIHSTNGRVLSFLGRPRPWRIADFAEKHSAVVAGGDLPGGKLGEVHFDSVLRGR